MRCPKTKNRFQKFHLEVSQLDYQMFFKYFLGLNLGNMVNESLLIEISENHIENHTYQSKNDPSDRLRFTLDCWSPNMNI